MNVLFSYLTLRTVIIFASTAFSLAVVMLLLNIITIDELALILKLSPEATNALKLVFARIQEVTGNILDIIGQLLNRLFDWAGIDIDLSKIKVDIQNTAPTNGITNSDSISHGGKIPGRAPINPNPQQ